MTYTITAVGRTREDDRYQTSYGTNINYRVRFQESGGTVVQLSQKETTPPPKVGQTLEGSIDMSGKFGPKFVKEFNKPGYSKTPKKEVDTHTMYVAYSKDIVVQLIASMEDPTGEQFKTKFEKSLEYVRKGAAVLEQQHNVENVANTFGSTESNKGIEPPEGF